ncbi:MAG: hypothetical protein ACD_75C00185G0013 [uncultured bacterium]|nr:MAG: hypothetical protein ACD_75C00185G0013 [uncultured bacterium]
MASRISGIIPLLVITLFCIGAVEGGYTILEYFILQQPAEEVAVPAIPIAKDPAGLIPIGTKRDHTIILTRNLFGPSGSAETVRPAPPPDAAADLKMSDLGIVLVGTIGGSEGTHRAVILDKKMHKQELYKVGDMVHGAHIKEILRGKVILAVNGKDELLDISEAATVRQVAKPPPPGKLPPKGKTAPTQQLQPKETIIPIGQLQPNENQAPDITGTAEDTPLELDQPAEMRMEQPTQVGPEDVPPPVQAGEPPAREIVRPRIIRPSRTLGKG